MPEKSDFPPRSLEHRVRTDNLVYEIGRQPVTFLMLVLMLGLLVSPLWLFILALPTQSTATAKDLAEIIEHVATALAFLGGAAVGIKWFYERHDRATDVLIKLNEIFIHSDLDKGKASIEAAPAQLSLEVEANLDRVLRFYVVLCGINSANQVPERSLSLCYAWWLSHYYRSDAGSLRRYVDRCYPTLRSWLREDIRRAPEQRFFRPNEFWQLDIIADEFKQAF